MVRDSVMDNKMLGILVEFEVSLREGSRCTRGTITGARPEVRIPANSGYCCQ